MHNARATTSRAGHRAHHRAVACDSESEGRGGGGRVEHDSVCAAGSIRARIRARIRAGGRSRQVNVHRRVCEVQHGLQRGGQLEGDVTSGHDERGRSETSEVAGRRVRVAVGEKHATSGDTPTQHGRRHTMGEGEATHTATGREEVGTGMRERAAETTQHTAATRRRRGQSGHHRVEHRLRRDEGLRTRNAEARGRGGETRRRGRRERATTPSAATESYTARDRTQEEPIARASHAVEGGEQSRAGDGLCGGSERGGRARGRRGGHGREPQPRATRLLQ